MALLKRVTNALERISPLALAESWDNVGLVIEAPFPNPRATRVLLTIDLTNPVLDEALAMEPPVGVIVAYHPPLFRSVKKLTLQDAKQRVALKCAGAGISIFSPHSALDSTVGGVNDWLAAAFRPAISSISHISAIPSPPVAPYPASSHELFANVPLPRQPGLGRIVTLSIPLPLEALVERIKTCLALKSLRVTRPFAVKKSPDVIQTIAVCAGSGSSMLAPLAGTVDLLFTGEMSHHDLLSAQEAGTAVVLAEHSNTERGYLGLLQSVLQSELAKDGGERVEVVVGTEDRDPVEYM